MKILHICLANFYIDGYSYQENLLPKYHKKMGLDVEIIASLVSFNENGEQCILGKGGSYFNEHNILVTRLEYKGFLLSKRLRVYRGTYQAICKSKPDTIFIHGCQFLDIKSIVKYVKLNPSVKIYVDNHADFSNSARSFLSKNVLHKIIWRYCAHKIEPYTVKFYGVLPARVEFLKDVYKLPEAKIKLLVMGADDEKVVEAREERTRNAIREKYNIKTDDFLIITGGKIDNAKKQILLLMEAIRRINDNYNNVKLLVFGSIINELIEDINKYVDGHNIQYIGWIESDESYKYFAAGDLAVFPGRHSVYWEQVVGLGTPIIAKYWEGTTHIDIGGNCLFLFNDTVDDIEKAVTETIKNKELYSNMREVAITKGMEVFSYEKIAKASIGIDNS